MIFTEGRVNTGVTVLILGGIMGFMSWIATGYVSGFQKQFDNINNTIMVSNEIHLKLVTVTTRNETMILGILKELEKTTDIAESNEKILIAMK